MGSCVCALSACYRLAAVFTSRSRSSSGTATRPRLGNVALPVRGSLTDITQLAHTHTRAVKFPDRRFPLHLSFVFFLSPHPLFATSIFYISIGRRTRRSYRFYPRETESRHMSVTCFTMSEFSRNASLFFISFRALVGENGKTCSFFKELEPIQVLFKKISPLCYKSAWAIVVLCLFD